jgi:hypothetical protein
MAGPKSRLLKARTAAGRLGALEQFLEFWFGRRRREYGEPAKRLRRVPLPYPLRRFYAFAGRWPSAEPEKQELFYTGGAGHHLRPPDDVSLREDGKLDFFMEYQGDWVGLTLPRGNDPPVWLSGWLEEGDDDERTVQVCDSLSRFLVTHCLMTILYEMENAIMVSQDKGPLVDHFNEAFEEPLRDFAEPVLLWEASDLKWPNSCLDYEGSFYLFCDWVLVHRSRTGYHFGALKLAGVRTIVGRLDEG